MGILPDWMIERDIKITPFEKYNREKQLGKVSWGLGSYGYDARIGYKFRVFKAFAAGCEHPVVDPLNFNPKLLEEVDYSPPDMDAGHIWEGPDMIGGQQCKYCGVNIANKHRDHVTWTASCQQTKRTAVPDHILIPPNSFALGETVEWFELPRDVLCVVLGKSTYARCGIIVNVTPGEPEWRGRWTVEISNTTPLPAKIYCGQGIMQCLFLRTDGYRDIHARDIQQLYKEVRNSEEIDEDRMKAVMKEGTCRVSYADKKGKYQDQTGMTNPTVTKKE